MASDVELAARLIGHGLRPKSRPARNLEYAELVRRYRDRTDSFRDAVDDVARGLDLTVLNVDPGHGIVLAAVEGSEFEVKMTDYSKRTGGEGRASERVLHALIHLGAAANAFPRPVDLTSPSYVGRITVEGVERFVREAVTRLDEKASADDDNADAIADRPDLEAAWRVYRRRAGNPSSRDGRLVATSTTGMASKALNFLADSGLLVRAGDERGGTFTTTTRYRVHVIDAGGRMFDDLLHLDVTEVTDSTGTLVPLAWTPSDVATVSELLPES